MNCEMCIGFLMVSSSQGAKIDLTLIGFVLTILRPGVAHAWLPCNAASALCYCFLLLLPFLSLRAHGGRSPRPQEGIVPTHIACFYNATNKAFEYISMDHFLTSL